MGVFKSVEYKEISITAATEGNLNNLSKSQAHAQCTPFYSSRQTASNVTDQFHDRMAQVEIVDNSGAAALKVSASARVETDAQVFQVFVVEWAAGITIEKVAVTGLSDTVASLNVTVNDVSDQTTAFLMYSYQSTSPPTSDDDWDNNTVQVRWNGASTTSVTLSRRSSAGDCNGVLYVIKCSSTEFIVEHATEIDVTGSSIDQNTTINTTVEADTFIVHSYETAESGDDMTDGLWQADLEDSTHVRVRRTSAGSASVNATSTHSIQVVECQANEWDVQRNTALTLATASQTDTLSSSIDQTRSLINCLDNAGHPTTAGRNNSSNGNQTDDVQSAADFSADNTVRYRMQLATLTNSIVSYEVVQFADPNTLINPGTADLVLTTKPPAELLTAQLILSTSGPQVQPTTIVTPKGQLDLVQSFERPDSKKLILSASVPDVTAPVSADHTRNPPAQDLTLTATVPAKGFGIGAPVQDLVLSASAPVARASVPVGTQDLVLSPSTPSKDFGFFPQTQDLVLTTTATGVRLSIEPAASDLVLSPASPVARPSIEPPAADLVVSPTVPAKGFGIGVSAGDLVLTLTAPGVRESVEVGTQDLVLSSTAPSKGFGIGASSQDLVLSASIPGVRQSVEVAAQNLALSPTAPAISVGFDLAAPAQDLLFSPTAPSKGFGFFISSQELVLSPTAPVVRPSIEAPSGDLALSPTIPAVSVGFSLTVPTQELVLTPTAPFSIPSEEIPTADLVLTSTAPALRISIEPGRQDLSLSPTTPAKGFGIGAPAQDLLLSPTTPDVISVGPITKDPPSVDLLLSATVPTVQAPTVRTPPANDLTLTSAAPFLGVGMPGVAADLSLSPTTPTPGRGFFAATGDLILTLAAPTATPSEEVPRANLALSASAPEAFITTLLVPSGADLVLSPSIPTRLVSTIPPTQELALSAAAPLVDRTGVSVIEPGTINLILSATAPALSILTAVRIVADSLEPRISYTTTEDAT